MAFTDFEFKGGILGQGCYINGFATKADFYHCKLPALTILSLMDLGHWQLKMVTGDIYRDEAMQAQSWRIDNLLGTINDARARLPQSNSDSDMLLPLATLMQCYWRANRDVREQAIVRLQNRETDAFCKRLARVLAQLPEQTGSMPEKPDA